MILVELLVVTGECVAQDVSSMGMSSVRLQHFDLADEEAGLPRQVGTPVHHINQEVIQEFQLRLCPGLRAGGPAEMSHYGNSTTAENATWVVECFSSTGLYSHDSL